MLRILLRSCRRAPVLAAIGFALLLVPLLAGTGASSAMAQVDSAVSSRQSAKPPAKAKVGAVKGVKSVPHRAAPPVSGEHPYKASAVTLPAPGTAKVTLPATAGAGPVRVGSSPVSVQPVVAAGQSAAGPVTVQVLPAARAQALGLDGAAFTLSAPAARSRAMKVSFDYSAFAQRSGGGYGGRLGLVVLPDCAAGSTAAARCSGRTATPARNDARDQTVSTQLTVPASGRVVLGVTPDAGASGSSSGDGGGPSGSYSATTLSPSSSWAQGGSNGSFTYSYPFTLPSSASSLQPNVALSYDSGVVDGETSATSAQSSWVGDGWDTPENYIEQTFETCTDVSSTLTNVDDCYAGPILTLVLNGQSTDLVCTTDMSSCTPQDDDGSVVKRLTGTSNGTYDGDYWTITKRDGTTYTFGLNQLPGYSSGHTLTNSVQTVPVYSFKSTDPCYHKTAATFAGSVCDMGYRWNLDYVKDSHGQAMSYFYTPSTNYYGESKGAARVSYVRDDVLKQIDYGIVDPANAYGAFADKVVLTAGVRCVSGTCAALSSSNTADYPDVPYDLECSSSGTCDNYAPSFFSTSRLTDVETFQYNTAAAAYKPVDDYALAQTIPTATSGTVPTLFLSTLQHTGYTTSGGTTTSAPTPPLQFTPTSLQNRVDTTTVPLPAMYRNRIGSITTETGGVITVLYGLAKPCSSPVKITASSNTSSCFPVMWTPEGYVNPITDWFDKYDVTGINETDTTGGAPPVSTTYEYDGGAAWHYDDNEVVRPKYRTYGQFRGFADVLTRTGGGSFAKTLTDVSYYRGMTKDNSSATVNVTDSLGGVHEDAGQLAGDVLETRVYQGDGGPLDHTTITSYWQSPATATRVRTGLTDLNAHVVNTAEVYSRQAVTSGSSTTYRDTETDTTYDATTTDATYGLPVRVYSHSVPVAAAYDRCATTTYAKAGSSNLVGLVSGEETDSVACGGFTEASPASAPSGTNTLTAPANVTRPDQVVSASRSFYDDPAFSTTFPQTVTPSAGNVTMTQQASGYSGSAFSWLTTAKSGYDGYGRQTSTTDGLGRTSSTTYTNSAYGLTTATKQTNAKSQSTTTTLNPEHGLTLTSTDANAVTTTSQYDPLGRVSAVWEAGRATSTNPNYKFDYAVHNDAVSGTTASELNSAGQYANTTTLYDSLLRKRQVQEPSSTTGRLVTDTIYDTRGWVEISDNGWWDSATRPNLTIVSAANLQDQVPNSDLYTYDGLGQQVIDSSRNEDEEISHTTTIYGGDRTTVVPPAGGITQTTYTDVLGRKTKLAQYSSAPAITPPTNTTTGHWTIVGGTTQNTSYGYDGHGNQATTTDPAGHVTTSTYDLLGNVISSSDPDAGTTSSAYDADGDLLQTTDSRGKSMSYTYDELGRMTASYTAPTSGQVDFGQPGADQAAKWVYDNSDNAVSGMSDPNGHQTGEASYAGGAAYTIQSQGFNAFGDSLGDAYTIPSGGNGSLGGTYTFGHTYNTSVDLPLTDTYPAVGGAGLPAETVTRGYAGLNDDPTSLVGLSYAYTSGVSYDGYGRVSLATLGTAGGTGAAYLNDTWDLHTGDLTDQKVSSSLASPSAIDEHAYSYDASGNPTKDVDTRRASPATSETQCYGYSPLDQLSSAWTATDGCAAAPTSSAHGMVGDPLGSSSTYWTSWTYNPAGQRAAQVQHAVSTGTDSTTTYGYGTGTGGSTQPTTMTSSSTTGATTGSTSYVYDSAGNMTTRTTAAGAQTLTWGNTGRLNTVSTTPPGGSAVSSSYVYDADSNLLLERDGSALELYLPGEEITQSTAGTVTGVRYYALPGGGTAYRTGSGNAHGFEIGDDHGTDTLLLDYTGAVPTWRQFTPFGAARGPSTTAFPDNRTFLDAPTDTTTGLTIIGAREYDPVTGQFVSLDPDPDYSQPLTVNGYSYAANNPLTFSDPTGERLSGCDACGAQDPRDPATNWAPHRGKGGKTVWSPTRPPYKVRMTNTAADERRVVQARAAMMAQRRAAAAAAAARRRPWYRSGKFWMSAATIGLGILDVAQLGLDPVTDAGEGALVTADLAADGGEAAAEDAAEEGEEAAESCATNSFAAATLVVLASGRTEPISKLTIGTKVRSLDPATGKQVTGTVSAIYKNQDTHFTDLTFTSVSKGHRSTIVMHTTSGHLVWDATTRTFVLASKLQVGHRARTSGKAVWTLAAVRSWTGSRQMYDITVDSVHTFNVEFAGVAVLVHNCARRIKNVSREKVAHFDSFNAARAAARESAGLGDEDTEDFVGELGPLTGRVTGRQSADGLRGWRIDWDANTSKGFHVNWWDRTAGDQKIVQSYGANIIDGGSESDFYELLSHFPGYPGQ